MTQLPFGLGVHLRPAGGREEPEYLPVLLGKHPALREGLTHLRAKGLQRRGQPVHPVLGGTGLVTLEELGVARQTVISAFSIIFGALMFGLALAFGLGGQDLARKLLERYLGNTKKVKDKEPQPL